MLLTYQHVGKMDLLMNKLSELQDVFFFVVQASLNLVIQGAKKKDFISKEKGGMSD